MNSGPRPRVLLVEDTEALSQLYQSFLANEAIDLECVATGQAALDRLATAPPSVMILDLKLPDMNGRKILSHVANGNLPTCVLVMTAFGDIETAVDAMRLGARDFLTKPFTAKRLRHALRETLQQDGFGIAPQAEERSREGTDFESFVGTSPAMSAVYRAIENAARSKAPVFISGETGTGKELCAQAIHRRSPRKDRPFIVLNCASIPKDLMESEVFGHTRGAFTGATQTRSGAAKLAHGGTLFLDEICEMAPELQAKLLRFLQSGCFQPLGSDRTETVDARLVCATNRDPLEEIAAGRLREDLYYRVHVVPVHLPPLRERRVDILPIARHFLATFAREEGVDFESFSPAAEMRLESYDWPGNVRQLQNVVRSALVLYRGRQVTEAMLSNVLDAPCPARPHGHGNGVDAPACDAIRPLRAVERELIEAAIACCDGNVVEAAMMLKINPSTIYRKRSGWCQEMRA
ncbi:MAG: sigma-54-dependent Fis family transcriptional regulator [Alphaproteobacteria bacterium]|nr:MAG: sigma-54-dependent Fis family transcriptional regulator [Alphaproteobacteria bacterium]